jgi:hypothetical protein
MVGFEFLHFLRVMMSYLKGNQVNWLFKCNLFLQMKTDKLEGYLSGVYFKEVM